MERTKFETEHLPSNSQVPDYRCWECAYNPKKLEALKDKLIEEINKFDEGDDYRQGKKAAMRQAESGDFSIDDFQLIFNKEGYNEILQIIKTKKDKISNKFVVGFKDGMIDVWNIMNI